MKIVAKNDLMQDEIYDQYRNGRQQVLRKLSLVGDPRFDAVMDFCRTWGMVTARPVPDSDNKTVEPMPVPEVVDRAFSMVAAIYDEGTKRGWLVPTNWPEENPDDEG